MSALLMRVSAVDVEATMEIKRLEMFAPKIRPIDFGSGA